MTTPAAQAAQPSQGAAAGALLALAAALVLSSGGAACTSSDETVEETEQLDAAPPTAAEVLSMSGSAMADISSVAFTITQEGAEVPIDEGGLVTFTAADGRYAAPGSAEAIVAVDALGAATEIGAVVTVGTGGRDLVNDARCPDDQVGEVHHDSLVVSGTLWEIRELLGAERADALAYQLAAELPAEPEGVGQTAGVVVVLGQAVDAATQGILDFNRSPGRKVGQPDNRDSHFYFALYWAKALAEQSEDAELALHFAPIAAALAEKEDAIVAELAAAQGAAADLGGYYHTDPAKAAEVMRPSATLNAIIGG